MSFTLGDHGGVFTRPHVAYAIDKRCGNAVQRNQLRRRLRALVGEVASDLVPGAYLIRTEPDAASLTFAELRLFVAPTAVAASLKAVKS